MPFIRGAQGSGVDGAHYSGSSLRVVAGAMRKRAREVEREAEGRSGSSWDPDQDQARMLRSDAAKMRTNADRVQDGDISAAASAYRREDTAARDEYPFAFHRLLRSLGYLSWLRGYPGDHR